MKSNCRWWKLGMAIVLGCGAGSTCLAQEPPVQYSVPVQFSGVINDYSQATGGPWEMHGQWALFVNEWTGIADFSADLTMSGYGKTSTGTPDATAGGAGAHTHHIRLTNATVTWNTDGCPAYSPSTYGGFQVKETVSLMTGNGSNAPFETNPPSSVLQVCVSGGKGDAAIPFSNITLTFQSGSPAIKHFGAQPIHGVIQSWNNRWELLGLLGH